MRSQSETRDADSSGRPSSWNRESVDGERAQKQHGYSCIFEAAVKHWQPRLAHPHRASSYEASSRHVAQWRADGRVWLSSLYARD